MAISKMLVVSMLLLALASCEPANLRGTADDSEAENRTSLNEVDDQDAVFHGADDGALLNRTDDQQAWQDILHGASMLRSLGTRTCGTTVKANQCLMARANRAEKPWNSSWTEYVHKDLHLSSTNLKTDCSGFVNWALRGCQTNRLGDRVLREVNKSGRAGRKRARNFYQAFGESSSGKWCRVEDFRKVDTGDLLVYDIYKQVDDEPGDSGHIMIAYRSPFERGVTSDGKLVFAQKIIDSTSRAHFDYFTFKETRGSCRDKCGAGVGYVYVWTDSRGSVLAIRLRGKGDRNVLDCTATKGGRSVDVPCFPQTNHENHHYRIGRLRH